MMESSSSIGFLIGLGKKLVQNSNVDLDEVIMPRLDQIFGDQVFPRVALSYGILLWFTLEVNTNYISYNNLNITLIIDFACRTTLCS